MPTFGRAMLTHWLLDPACTYLNHSTVGAPPRRVLRRQQALRDEIERQPSRFLLRELHGHHPAPWRHESRLREAVRAVAPFLGTRADDLVFVPNVTVGVNAVLRSLALGPGDELVVTSLAYGAVALTAAVAAREHEATVRTAAVPLPMRDAGAVVDAVEQAITSRTRIVVVDHVTSATALVLPVADIVEMCHRRHVPVLVDGAHAPGAMALDIPALGADWYAANLHKWAHAPRPCGILWARPERQATLHHPIVSWGRDHGFLEEFEVTATLDPTACLAAPEGLTLLAEWGFSDVLRYMHDLALEAADILTQRWGSALPAPRSMIGAMVSVPLPIQAGSTDADAARLRLAVLLGDQIEVQIHAEQGRLWARVSAQVYNEAADVVRLADAVDRHTS